MQRNVSVVEDLNGNKIVFIHDVRFKGRQAIEWEDVELYLKQYVGEARIIKSTNDMVYIGADLPEECIFRKNCASVPEERCAIPLQTEQSSAG